MTTGTILAYLAQSAVFYCIGYIFYKMLMSNIKQPALNRASLLVIYIGSLLAPIAMIIGSGNGERPSNQEVSEAYVAPPVIATDAITASQEDEKHSINTADAHKPLSLMPPDEDPEPDPILKPMTIKILIGLSLAGSLFALCQLIFSLGKIVMLKHFGDEHRIGNLRLFKVHSSNFSPFSFLNCMFISEAEKNDSEEMIIAHEMGHIRHHHWIDLFFIKLCAIFMWWNPIVWLLGSELRTVHEFQADEDVLNSGHRVTDYQMLLVRKAASYNLSPLTSHFAQSRLKRRFIMMKQRRPGRLAPMRILAVAASFIVASLILGTDSVNAAIQRLRDVSFNDISFDGLSQHDTEEIFSETGPTDKMDETLEEVLLETDDTAEKTDTTKLTTESPTSEKATGYAKNLGSDGTSPDGSRTVTVHDEDTGTTFTYTYNNGNLVSRSISSSATSSENNTSHSSSTSSSSSSGSNDSDNAIYMDITGLNNLSELSELSELSNYSPDIHTYVDDGAHVIIINGKDTTFVWRETTEDKGTSEKLNKWKFATKQRDMTEKQKEFTKKQKEFAVKQREFALKQAEKAREQAAKQRETALKQAEKAREQALKQLEKEQEEAVDNETTTFEWIKQSGVTSFSNSGGKTHINVKIVSKDPIKVNGARVRYNGEWYDIKRWNVNSNKTPFNTVTTIELTGPKATYFSQDDIVEIIATNTKYRYPTIAKK